jgi:uncharacterized membrane protein (UPF0136 family)
MNTRRELAARRAMLVARCERQRRELAVGADGLAQSLHTVDTAVGLARRVTSHPLLLAGAVVAAVVIVRPRRLLQGISWGLSAAVAARHASAWLSTGT